MNGQGFAYFRWLSTRSPGPRHNAWHDRMYRSLWLDMQQRAFHRKMAKPKDKRA